MVPNSRNVYREKDKQMKYLALIGVGRWGKNIIKTLELIAGSNLKYLCTRDWPNLLEKVDLNAVIVATPPSTHFSIATAFLIKGVSVFVEKPMVLNLRAARKLRAVVKKSSETFMVGYQYLYNDYLSYIEQEIDRGSLGKILEVKSEHLQSPPRPDVDILWDAGSHPLSIFQHFFAPHKLISVTGNIKHDSVSIEAIFANAPRLKILASCFGNVKTRKLTIVGELATAILDETLEKDKLTITHNKQVIVPKIDISPPLRNELEHFIYCVKAKTTPLTDVDFGYQVTKWLERISTITKRNLDQRDNESSQRIES